MQHGDKWRAAQDYSQWTNQRAGSIPFTLPTVWDAAGALRPGSFMAKYDLRDGFWSVPVAPASRHLLMVRHPATGRLYRCRSLPFGYALSPYIFCGVTEAVADIFRRRMAGRGLHVFVFVDDYLIVGCDEAAVRLGMAEFERLLEELGLPWARHKRRGPALAMEFLGHLIANAGPTPCIALTEGRRRRVSAMIESWMLRRPSGGFGATAEPRELAELMGHLVFASEVLPRGRTYL